MRKFDRLSVLLTFILLPCAVAQGADKKAAPAVPTDDYVARSYPAQMSLGILDQEFDKMSATMKSTDTPFNFLPETAMPYLDNDVAGRVAYVVHVAKWNKLPGNYALEKSRWYVYTANCSDKGNKE